MAETIIYPAPPSDFCKSLHEFDPNLQLNWDASHGVWSVWCKEESGELSHVMNVMNNDGSYRSLDGRTIKVLKANRYFVQNPKELERKLCDDILAEREKQQKFSHEEMKHLGNDKTLGRKFKEIAESARSIAWEEWITPKHIKGEDGNPLMTVDKKGRKIPLTYKPHFSLLENGGIKPTTLEDL